MNDYSTLFRGRRRTIPGHAFSIRQKIVHNGGAAESWTAAKRAERARGRGRMQRARAAWTGRRQAKHADDLAILGRPRSSGDTAAQAGARGDPHPTKAPR